MSKRRNHDAAFKARVALPLIRLCLNLCGGGAAFLPSTVLARLGRTWRV